MKHSELDDDHPVSEGPLALTDPVELAEILERSGLATAQSKSELQVALEEREITAGWCADRMIENAISVKPITYLGQITHWVPDNGNRNRGIDQILKVRGEGYATEKAYGTVDVEISLDERRQIQIKATARYHTWGRPYKETPEQVGDEAYPT